LKYSGLNALYFNKLPGNPQPGCDASPGGGSLVTCSPSKNFKGRNQQCENATGNLGTKHQYESKTAFPDQLTANGGQLGAKRLPS